MKHVLAHCKIRGPPNAVLFNKEETRAL